MPVTQSTLNDFKRAHRKAAYQEIFARLTGQTPHLLSYDEVLTKLQIQGQSEKGLRDIPLNAIIGSVGRYQDFTRSFFPRFESDQERWARVKTAMESMVGVPPIEVYKVGEAYFVRDGNHRVSIARQIDMETIQAYVTEVKTRVQIDKDTDLDDLIIKAEYANFLEKTRLDRYYPDLDLLTTAPGHYGMLFEHISVHRYFMGIDEQREVSWEEAVRHWYDQVFMPVVRLIRRLGVLRDFPERTETDLYLWFMQYKEEIQQELGWKVSDRDAAESFSQQLGTSFRKNTKRFKDWLLDLITPDSLDSGPASGSWRKEHQAQKRSGKSLFENILVPIHDHEPSWRALKQARLIAEREQAAVLGLHVFPKALRKSEHQLKKNRKLQKRFDAFLQSSGMNGSLAAESGDISDKIVERSRWTDLIVINLSFPPALKPLRRLRSGFRLLISRSGVPVMAVKERVSPLGSALLAFDASPKSREALFLAAYVAQRWDLKLSVLSVDDGSPLADTAQEVAREYLQGHQIEAQYIVKSDAVSQSILNAAREQNAEMIIMGSYGFTPILELFLGSAVDGVLKDAEVPVLICR